LHFTSSKLKSITLPCCTIAATVALGMSEAHAQAAGQTLGSQVQSIAKEFSTAGGFAGSTAMYVAALVTFVAGVWFLWQSRQPENRESGKVAAGLTGLVLTGLFVAGGSWIQKASYTTTGAGAKVTDQAGVITFQ
jgi:phage-related protein